MKTLIILALTTLLSAFLGSFLGGYLKRKDKNLATHQDIDKLVAQVAALSSGPSEAAETVVPVIDPNKLYEEIGKAWQYFDSWREKIFAGYLSVLAALAFGLSKSASIHVRAVLFAFGILVSVAFWILDFRTTELINLCQAAGDNLAGPKGLHRALSGLRFATTKSWKKSWLSYGTAISLLVASVIATSFVGLAIYLWRWRSSTDAISLWCPVVAIALAAVLLALLRKCAGEQWAREKTDYEARIAK